MNGILLFSTNSQIRKSRHKAWIGSPSHMPFCLTSEGLWGYGWLVYTLTSPRGWNKLKPKCNYCFSFKNMLPNMEQVNLLSYLFPWVRARIFVDRPFWCNLVCPSVTSITASICKRSLNMWHLLLSLYHHIWSSVVWSNASLLGALLGLLGVMVSSFGSVFITRRIWWIFCDKLLLNAVWK